MQKITHVLPWLVMSLAVVGPIAYAQTPVTWSASDKSATIAISDAGLSLSASGSGWQTARANTSRNTGKWYFENHMVAVGAYVLCGVANGSAPLNDSIGHTSGGWGYRADGLLVANGSGTSAPGYSSGDRCMVAYDADAGKLWFGKNGTWLGSGNPSAGTNATYTGVTGGIFPAASFYNSSASPALTANFGQSAMTYTVPSGFTPGWYEAAPATEKDLSPIFAMQAFGYATFTLLGAICAGLFIAGIKKGRANAAA